MSDLAEPNCPLACISVDKCLQFCDDMPSVASPPPTTNNTEFRSGLFDNQISSCATDQLKCLLVDCWAQLSQDTLNQSIGQLL